MEKCSRSGKNRCSRSNKNHCSRSARISVHDGQEYPLSQSSNTKSFPGAVGVFIGYKFPISVHAAFEPMLAYHYIGKSSTEATSLVQPNLNSVNKQQVTVYTKATSVLNVVDLTIQGNYRLNSGVNFFVQPGVAIASNKFTQVDTSNLAYGGSGTNRSFRPEVAFGMGTMVTKHVNVFAKYNYMRGNDLNSIFPTLTPNLSSLLLGISFEA